MMLFSTLLVVILLVTPDVDARGKPRWNKGDKRMKQKENITNQKIHNNYPKYQIHVDKKTKKMWFSLNKKSNNFILMLFRLISISWWLQFV